MAYADTTWYVNYGNGSSTGYYGVTAWATGTAKSVGALVRQNSTPTNGNERVFVCIVAGNTHATTEPTWSVTRGAKTTDNTITWQEVTGQPAMNGDATNTIAWSTVKNTSVSLGQIIKDGGGLRYFICTTAGTAGNGAEPTWNTTAGATTADNTVTWTCLGTVGSFSAWGAPIPRLLIATGTLALAGNTIYVRSDHAETQAASMTISVGNSTRQVPYKVLCVNSAGSTPPVAADVTTGATVTTTGANNMFVNAWMYCVGMTFSVGTGATIASMAVAGGTFINCAFKKLGTSATSAAINIATGTASIVTWDNTTFTAGASGDGLGISGSFLWKNTASAIQGATIPSPLFVPQGIVARMEINGVDLSALGSGKTLFSYSVGSVRAVFRNCKLGASVTRTSGTLPYYSTDVEFIDCDSGATIYNQTLDNELGTQTVETTIVRTGGATDGTTPIAWKAVTTSVAAYHLPFCMKPLAIWNDTTGANVTVTVYGIWGGGAVPNNDDIWMEVHYHGSASTPQATVNQSNRKATLLTTAAGQASDTSTWGGSTTKFKMSVTLSSPQPQLKGPIYVYIFCGKASSTFYIDPKPVLS